MKGIVWRQKIILETAEYSCILLRKLQAVYCISNLFLKLPIFSTEIIFKVGPALH
jgi:hypothetical protein